MCAELARALDGIAAMTGTGAKAPEPSREGGSRCAAAQLERSHWTAIRRRMTHGAVTCARGGRDTAWEQRHSLQSRQEGDEARRKATQCGAPRDLRV